MKFSLKKSLLLVTAFCLFAVLAIGGVFAKYYNTAELTNSDKVTTAKWGVTITANAGTPFANAYGGADAEAEVKAAGTALTLAPGTKGEFGTISVTITANEVDINLDATLNFSYTGITEGTIKITVDGTAYANSSEALAAIKTAIGDSSTNDVAAGQSDYGTKTVAIGWEWTWTEETETDLESKEVTFSLSAVVSASQVQPD